MANLNARLNAHVFGLDARIETSEARQIIRTAFDEGYSKGALEGAQGPVWQAWFATEVVREALPPDLLAWTRKNPERWESWTYLARLDERVQWAWRKHPCAELLRNIVERVPGLFERITRVKVFVQLPGASIGPHRDLIVGCRYPDMRAPLSSERGDRDLVYLGRDWIEETRPRMENPIHRRQGYLSLKIPLTLPGGEGGRPFVEIDGERLVFAADHRLYMLNEADGLHGAEATDEIRGVVFVDGLMAPDMPAGLRRVPLRVVERRRV